ncbi:procathepsin L-like [Culicoides brevitarsis]|uniref:procathepsin L-like n=1 Tax=Culicoides brevitarsis TaxID=469753 RepID=UPI00307B1C1F
MTDEEFEEIYANNKILGNFEMQKEISSNITRPIKQKDINWYTPKIPVKNQGRCGACWAFAATGLLEYDYFIKKKEIVSLSEQELLDCVPIKYNYGCKGGIPYYALEFVKDSGINYEKDYPYEKRQRKCQIRLKKAPKLVQNVQMTPIGETAIYETLFYSPVIVAVYANSKVWKSYKKGFITATECGRNRPNHAILILGVVREGGQRLWYARNSYGETWGLNGHLKLAMNENACQIGDTHGFYVTV